MGLFVFLVATDFPEETLVSSLSLEIFWWPLYVFINRPGEHHYIGFDVSISDVH